MHYTPHHQMILLDRDILVRHERGEQFLRNVVTGERLQPATKGRTSMTERKISRHQCFFTQHEILSAFVVQCRLIVQAMDHHLQTDLSDLDLVELEAVAFRIFELAQMAKNARIVEAAHAVAHNTEFGGTMAMECALTVGHPDGTVS